MRQLWYSHEIALRHLWDGRDSHNTVETVICRSLMAVSWLSHDCLLAVSSYTIAVSWLRVLCRAISWLSHGCLAVSWLSLDCLMAVSWLSQGCLVAVSGLSHDCLCNHETTMRQPWRPWDSHGTVWDTLIDVRAHFMFKVKINILLT